MFPTPQQTAQRSGMALDQTLRALTGVTLGGGVGLTLALAGSWIWLWSHSATLLKNWTLTAPLSASQLQQFTVTLALLGILSVSAVVVSTWFSAVLIGWTRAYLGGVRSWTQGEAVHLQRSEALRLSLNTTLSVTQWGSALGAAVLILAGILLVQTLGEAGLNTAALGPFSTGPELKLTLALLGSLVALGLVLAVWVGNLILAAARQWLSLTGAKLRGEPSEVAQPTAERLGNWLILCLVLLAFDIASRLSLLPLLAVARSFFASGLPESWLVLLQSAVWPLVAALLLGLMQSTALLLALLHLRRFALSAAQITDSPASESR
ncbi:hypothetical protein EHF33_07935 [Deinococcus psychrotolerans]|uniref:Uncharacterized protein n=1 Tax=Deinococcus psychrotolerans TaxID=2489213 RepID=A0A3G8YEU9_9DEIO|nr:hypothetical protein [Deinococcus psychrotolerans]AZI42687.1 hypothetical protein EHF33_07935 [Deinococcus psychrotolerans]